MLRTIAVILSGNAAAALMILARNLIVARLIPVADYGIASTFAITMAIVEMLSALGLQQQIVRDQQGEDPHLQAALQGFQVLRGALSAGALWLIARPMADFMAIPEATWAFHWLALVPLANGFVHFDIYRLNRRMSFGPGLLTTTVPALVSLMLVWPLAMLLKDYRVMLWAILAQAFLTAITSHLVAQRPYALVLDRHVMGRSLLFGWPILLNGALLFGIFNGDRLIVGHVMGMEPLAIFSMGLTLTMTPTLVLEKTAQSFFLPQLSRAVDDTTRFANLSVAAFQAHILCGLVLVAVILIFGDLLVTLLLGPQYSALSGLLVWLAIQQAIRLAKGGNSPSALARAQTTNSMLGSLPRVLMLAPAAWAAAQGASLEQLIQIGIIGEILGYGLTLILTGGRMGLPLRPLIVPSLTALAMLCAAALSTGGPYSLLLIGIALLCGLGSVLSMGALRALILQRKDTVTK